MDPFFRGNPMGFIGMRGPPQIFETYYNCYSMAVLGRSNIDEGDKIILPPSALDTIAQMDVEYPLLFELSKGNKSTHCGVLEFSAEEGRCYMPFWMMQNLNLAEGVIAKVKNTSLKKASFVKFKPQSVEFLEVSNPRVVLERALRKFTCLTVGDIIQINHASSKYLLKVSELRPHSAVSIVETDCEVDFEEPEGYKDSKYYKAEQEHLERVRSRTMSGDIGIPRQVQRAKSETEKNDKEEKVFQPFSGSGKRIDGKPLAVASEGINASTNSAKGNAAAAALARLSSSSSSTSSNSVMTSSTTSQPSSEVPKYQSKIGDKYSRVKSSSSAFSGTANKLT